MLNSADIQQLKNVFVHGFLTIEGMKMSKSKGNFILADHALNFSHPITTDIICHQNLILI